MRIGLNSGMSPIKPGESGIQSVVEAKEVGTIDNSVVRMGHKCILRPLLDKR